MDLEGGEKEIKSDREEDKYGMTSLISKKAETETRMVVAKALGEGEIGRS